ncbi:lasso peptide isopeptide bond-forming cyclase [Nocardiopsis exhalans]|nr:albusnodin/ikarugamycin family macrolactam cyclase [Nocardiopsis exhalans]
MRLLGVWPKPLIRHTVAHGRSALLLGECLATDEELREALSHGGSLCEAAGSAASLSGSYCAIVSQDGQTALATDLAGLHRLWYREGSEGIEFASTPLALVRGSTADLDPDALAARLFCSDFHTGLPGGSLHKRATEVPPDRVLLLNGASVSLAPRNPAWNRTLFREGAEALREALETGVRARVSGANTVTADLSGGMDSSTLALLAARYRDEPLPALTYTDPFAVNDDDADYAALLASRASGLAQVIVKGDAASLPFTGMDDVPLTDHPSLDTVIFARDRVRLLPASGASPHLVGDGGDAVLGAPLTYLTALTRRSGLPRLVQETRGWARLRHRPVHRIMRSVWRASRTTYAETLTALAARLEGLPSNGFRGNAPRVERNIVWAHLGPSAPWGTSRARATVAERLRHAAESVDDAHGVDAHALRMLRRHAADTRLFADIAAHSDVRVAAPFFDNQVVAACLSVPAVERASVFQAKPLLKAAFAEHLLAELYERRTKGDYGACEYHGVRRNAARLRSLVEDSRLADLGILEPHLIKAELERAISGGYAAMAAIAEVVSAEVWLRGLDRALALPAERSVVLEGER